MSRRDLLKRFGYMATLVLAPEIAHQAHNVYSAISRPERPFLTSPEPYSVVFGYSPNNNSLNYLPEIGIQPQILNFFIGGYARDYQQVFEQIRSAAGMGIVPMISWGVYEDVYTQTFHKHELFRGFINDLKSINSRFIFRPFYEANLTKTSEWWGESTPNEFRRGWSYLVNVFEGEGVNCSFLFCPNTTTNRIITSFFEQIYPGDDSVDFVGLDSYNKFSPYLWTGEHLHPNPSAEEELGHDIAVLQRIAPQKPLIISEINEYGDGSWTTSVIDYAVHAGAVAVLTFDWNKAGQGEGEIDWRISQRPVFLRNLRSLLEKEYWVHNNPEFNLSSFDFHDHILHVSM